MTKPTRKYGSLKDYDIKAGHSIPVPKGHQQPDSNLGRLRRELLARKVGGHFNWPTNKAIYDASYQTGIAITVRKTDNGYTVWRVK